MEGRKEPPSLLNLASTKSEVYPTLNGVDYRLKERVVICKKPRPINLGS